MIWHLLQHAWNCGKGPPCMSEGCTRYLAGLELVAAISCTSPCTSAVTSCCGTCRLDAAVRLATPHQCNHADPLLLCPRTIPQRQRRNFLLCCLQYRSLLPTTRNAHSRVSPSPDELLMILARNHGHPLPVENFTVEHTELGKIHWLVPVLPWKLDLDKVIKMGHLVVEVSQLFRGIWLRVA